jgi:prophage antirepressor-like protein
MRGNDMDSEKSLIVFQDKKIRRVWHNEEWFFSVVDIAAVLTEQGDAQKARKY